MDMQVRLTQFSHGGGCGCKIAPGVLEQILAKTAPGLIPKDLLVGIETSDDAAVYRINDRQAIVATTDFFMPIVDDPFDFGAIAATNAISDVYAMGGQPLFALALVGMPVNQIPLEVIRKILEGGESVCARAGIPIAGGHTIDSVEPIYGLVAIGLVDPANLKRNSGARPGDKLVLGKPIGVGVISAALKKGRVDDAGYKAMIDATTKLNTPGTRLGTPGWRPRPHRRDGLRPVGSPPRDREGLQCRREARLARDPDPSAGAGFRIRRNRHGRFREKLDRLRQSREARREHRRRTESASHGSADERRIARGLRARSVRRGARDLPLRGLRPRRRHRRDGRGLP
jgi:hypothetical protein